MTWWHGSTIVLVLALGLNGYASDGRYTIGISGSLEQFGSGWGGYPHAGATSSVNSWGTLGLTSLSGAFWDAINLTTVPNTLPSSVTTMSMLFANAVAFNQPIGGWDTSYVIFMEGMFHGATSFNRDLSSWCVALIPDRPEGFDTVPPLGPCLDPCGARASAVRANDPRATRHQRHTSW